MNNVCSENQCTACEACINVCPANCIEMVSNNYGTPYPCIDSSRCIKCKLCIKTCPSNRKVTKNIPQKTYAAWARNTNIRQRSSSGGIAFLLYKNFIKKFNGIVWGPMFNMNYDLVYESFESLSDLNKLIGSKYVYSKMGAAYKKIENQLSEERYVLFIGMPCQIAGLLNYLKNDYPRLFTVDLICHGMPPIKYLHEHIETILSTPKEQWGRFNISFREKHKYILRIATEEEILYRGVDFLDIYMMAYTKRMINREACYHCSYAEIQRVSDATLGDFWGLGDIIPFAENANDGINCFLQNTDKGEVLFNLCNEELVYEERTLYEAVAGNETLSHPMEMNKYRKRFIIYYQLGYFDRTVKRILIIPLVRNKLSSLIPPLLKEIIKAALKR